MLLKKINGQISSNNNRMQKINAQPTFSATLRIDDSNKILTSKQHTSLYKKAQKINCDCIFFWIENSNTPIQAQILKRNYRSAVENIDDIVPPSKAKKIIKSKPFQAIDIFLSFLLKRYK